MESAYDTKYHNPLIRNGNYDINNIQNKRLPNTIYNYTGRLTYRTQEKLNKESGLFVNFPTTLNINQTKQPKWLDK